MRHSTPSEADRDEGTDGPGGVSQYTVGTGGALEVRATPSAPAGDNPTGIALTPDQGPVALFTATVAAAGSPSSFNGSGSNSSDSSSWSMSGRSAMVRRS